MKPIALLMVVLAFVPAALAGDLPAGWIRAGSAPADYEMGVDTATRHTGRASAFLRAIEHQKNPNGFGTLMQMSDPGAYRGKRVRLTAWVKAEKIDGESWAGVWFRVDGERPQTDMLAFDNMQDRPIKGTADWTKVAIVLDVPLEAKGLAFGVLLGGAGQVWMDDLKFEVVALDVPTTGMGSRRNSVEPKNLDFEE